MAKVIIGSEQTTLAEDQQNLSFRLCNQGQRSFYGDTNFAAGTQIAAWKN